MPMQWNDQADARLFANVLYHHVVKLDYVRLAKDMGSGVTPKAISHRIAKIKEKANKYSKSNPYLYDNAASGSTKRGKKMTGKGKGLAKGEELEDDEIPIKMEVKMEDISEYEQGMTGQQEEFAKPGQAVGGSAGFGMVAEVGMDIDTAGIPATEMPRDIDERPLIEQFREQHGSFSCQNHGKHVAQEQKGGENVTQEQGGGDA